ncbi:MAG: tagatose 1,6-diphosphate aldolase [Acidimicrobiia bacterium]
MTAGKYWRLRRLADRGGRFTMLAVDQRPPIERLVAEARGEQAPRREDVSAVKTLLLEELSREVSAVLVDPLIAYPDGWRHLDPARGLLVTLEHAVYDEGPGGRRSGPIPGWSVEAIARLGGDAVKVLAWYRPDADPAVCEHQQAWVAEVGEACRRHDLPFVFELLVYPFAADHGSGDEYAEDPGKRAEAVIESVETFADPAFGVDLFKLESPIPAAELPPPDLDDGTTAGWFSALDRAAGRPWVMLSAGASADDFRRVLHYALDAGASGFLAGRAIWAEAMEAFPDLEACRAALRRDAMPYLRTLVNDTARSARPWFEHPGLDSPDGVGADFAETYGGAS